VINAGRWTSSPWTTPTSAPSAPWRPASTALP